MAVASRYGTPGELAYHQVLAHLVAEVGGNGAPISGAADEGMHDMHDMHSMKGMSMPSSAPTHAPH